MKMSQPDDQTHAIALSGVIREAANGSHYLEGLQCGACGEILVAHHRACPKCTTAGSLAPVRLADRGKLYTYTIVHRSFPGVETPFVSAVIALDGGGFLKGNLTGVAPDPSEIAFDMPLRVEFELMPAREGNRPLVRYLFVPDRPKSRGRTEAGA